MGGALGQQDGWPSAAYSVMGVAFRPPGVCMGFHGSMGPKDLWLHLDSLTCRSSNVDAQKRVQPESQPNCSEPAMYDQRGRSP